MPELKILVDRWYQQDGERRVLRQKGEIVDVTEEQAEWLEASGIAGDPSDEPEPVVDPEPDPVAEAPAEVEAEATPEVERPLNAANRAAWDAYATAVGVDPSKFKSKDELIAALP